MGNSYPSKPSYNAEDPLDYDRGPFGPKWYLAPDVIDAYKQYLLENGIMIEGDYVPDVGRIGGRCAPCSPTPLIHVLGSWTPGMASSLEMSPIQLAECSLKQNLTASQDFMKVPGLGWLFSQPSY
jgi:hypothetical protein